MKVLLNRQLRYGVAIAALTFGMAPMGAQAFQIETGSDIKIRWDNTVKYSAAFRVRSPDDTLLANVNGDDGDRNFDKGLISNRVDLLSEFDISYRGFGFSASGAAWRDQAYFGNTDNDSPATANSYSVANDSFTRETRDQHGQKVELLNAFAYGNIDLGSVPLNFRAGRHTLLWGESLFGADNGIAYGQAPIDYVKLNSVPNTQAKELFMPVTQISGTAQLTDQLTVAAYYQLEWRKSRIPAAGSYFSDADILDRGGERLSFAPVVGIADLYRGNDQEASDSGQFGVSFHYLPSSIDLDLGFYALRFNDKQPQVYLSPGAGVGLGSPPDKVGEYSLIYAEGIQLYGISASTTLFGMNVAGEVSTRRNTPLVSSVVLAPGQVADNDGNPAYAVGNSLHAQVSAIQVLGPGPAGLWDSAVLLGEVTTNHVLSITKNAAAFDPTRTRTAVGFRGVMEASYFQVVPGIDLTVPIGLGYNPLGKSGVATKFNSGGNGTTRGGDVSIGLTALYQQTWRAGVNYTHYYGNHATQTQLDRDFVSFTIQRSF